MCLSLPSANHQRVAKTLCLVKWLQRNRRDGGWWWEQRAWTPPAAISAGNPCVGLRKCCLEGTVWSLSNPCRAARWGEHGGSGTPTTRVSAVLPLVCGVSVQGRAGMLWSGSAGSTWLVGEAQGCKKTAPEGKC